MLDKIKGLSVKVKVLLGVACVAVVGIAGVGISANVQESRLIEKNLYMSLRYLEANDADMASDYLQDVGEEGNKKQRFVKDTAEIVCQQIKGNETLWRIRMNMLETDYEMDLDQRAIATYLEQGTENAYIDYSVVLQQMLQYLGIADKRLIVYGDEYGIVSTAMNSGYLSPEQRDAYKNLYSEEKMKNLVLGVALSNGDYYTALYEAIAMVNEDASEENRILLADVIARAAYAGYNVDESYFMSYWGEEYNAEAQAKAKEKLEKAGADSPAFDAVWLINSVTGCTRRDIMINGDNYENIKTKRNKGYLW